MNRKTPTGDAARRRTLRIAALAMACDLDPAVNQRRMADHVARVKAKHPDVRLVHFGETILGWYFKKGETKAYHERIAQPIPGPAVDGLAAVARKHGVFLSFGMTERAGDAIHNAHVVLSPDGDVLAVHRKVCRNDPVFAPGHDIATIADICGVRAALLICSDVQDFRVLRAIRRAHADVVLASLADFGTDLWITRMIGCLLDTRAVTANRVGQEGARFWPGLLSIVDRFGRIEEHALGKEQALVATLSFDRDSDLARLARRCAGAAKIAGIVCVMAVRAFVHAIVARASRSPASVSK
jgi:predicted amidohydrolase